MFLSLNGDIIPNHGYVVISEIGSTGDNTALLCNTHLPTPTGSINSGGNWFSPDETRVNLADVPRLTRNRGDMVVRLFRNTDDPRTPAEGIYHCMVQDDTGTLQTVYVGLYNSGGGTILFHW